MSEREEPGAWEKPSSTLQIDRLKALVKTLSETCDILTAQRDAAGWTKCWSDECVLPNGHADLHMTAEERAALQERFDTYAKCAEERVQAKEEKK